MIFHDPHVFFFFFFFFKFETFFWPTIMGEYSFKTSLWGFNYMCSISLQMK